MTNKKFEQSIKYRKDASKIIPGGAHTYSKGHDQFPCNYPRAIMSAKGARIIDVDGNEFIDWGMALTSTLLGYANDEVNEAVIKEIQNGINFTLPSYIEYKLAKKIIEQIDSAEMVKFGKNGSDVTTAAVRLARSYTNKNIVLRCADHPFFSIDDWFVGDTEINSGIPNSISELTQRFKYNDLNHFEEVVTKFRDVGIACAILQPSVTTLPFDGYLQGLRKICDREGILLIFDEVVTGARYHPKGAQYIFGVKPHLSTFGKAMANGYSFSALTGERNIMELGGLEHSKERVFLLSSTYGGETHHLRAAEKVMEILNRDNYAVTKYITSIGDELRDEFNKITKDLDIDDIVSMSGFGFKPYLNFTGNSKVNDVFIRNYLQQEMAKYGVIFLNIAPSLGHGPKELDQTLEAFRKSLFSLKEILTKDNPREFLHGDLSKPVFRKYN